MENLLFQGILYAISPTISEERRKQLTTVLDANGASASDPDGDRLTYFITNTLPGSDAIEALPEYSPAHLVTPLWVERSLVLAARQDSSCFSPDPALVFSGICAAATDLVPSDIEALSAGITSLGGQWRSALTKEVTHLFALSTGSAKYETAMHFRDAAGLKVLVPHWFDDSVRLGMRLPTEEYEWPEPRVFQSGWENGEEERKLMKLSTEKKALYDTALQSESAFPKAKSKNVWRGFKLMLSSALELSESQRTAHEADIRREGGVVIETRTLEDEVEKMEETDIFVTRYRAGPAYAKAYRLNKTIGTLSWLWYVRAAGVVSRPMDQLLHYPIPKKPIDSFSKHIITITNYTGKDREYLKKLIATLGAEFTPSMSGRNTICIAAYLSGTKTTKAISWSIPVVNHTWLEDTFVQWRPLALTNDKYTCFPPGLDFGNLLAEKGVGRIGYDDSELEALEREVSVEEEAVNGGNEKEEALKDLKAEGISAPTGTEQSMREVEDAVMDGGDVSMGAYLDMELPLNDAKRGDEDKMDVDDEAAATTPAKKKSASSKVNSTPSKTTTKPPSSKSPAKPLSNAELFESSSKAKPEDSGEKNEESKAVSPVKPPRKKLVRRFQGTPVTETSSIRSESVLDGPPRVRKLVRRAPGKPIAVEEKDERSEEEDEEKPKTSAKVNGKVSKAKAKNIESDSEVEVVEEVRKPSKGKDKRADRTGEQDEVEIQVSGKANWIGPKSKMKGKGRAAASDEEEEPRSSSKAKAKGKGFKSKDKDDDDVIVLDEDIDMDDRRDKPKSKVRPMPKTPKTYSKKRRSIAKADTDVEDEDEDEDEVPKQERTLRRRTSRSDVQPTPPNQSTTSPAKVNRTPHRQVSVLLPTLDQVRRSASKDAESLKKTSVSPKKAIARMESLENQAREGPSHSPKRGRVIVGSSKRLKRESLSSERSPSPSPILTKVKKPARREVITVDSTPEAGPSRVTGTPVTIGRTPSRRSAATKATQKLRDEVMPDVMNFQKELKNGHVKSAWDHEQASAKKLKNHVEFDKTERRGKKRMSAGDVDDGQRMDTDEDEPDKKKRRTSTGANAGGMKAKKGKVKEVSDDEDDDEPSVVEIRKHPRKSEPQGTVTPARPSGKISTTDPKTIKIMTTQVSLSDDAIKMMTRMGPSFTTKPSECTHLVARSLVRTEKFLCAMAVAPIVVTDRWVQTCVNTKHILVEEDFLLDDPENEKKYGFKLADALKRSKAIGGKVFSGMMFYITPKVPVEKALLKNVITAGGGTVSYQSPTIRVFKNHKDRYVISCPADISIWRQLAQNGVPIYNQELILTGMLRQEIDWNSATNKLEG